MGLVIILWLCTVCALKVYKCGVRRKWARDSARHCRQMGWVMNMDVSRLRASPSYEIISEAER
jgi:hypothetical protein